MIASKYAVAGVQILVLIITSIVAALGVDNVVTPVEGWQVGAIAVGAVGQYAVPLLEKQWAALGKFLVTLAAAAITAIVPIIDTVNGGPGFTGASILIVVLAVANAALTAWGVDVRLDGVRAAIADPKVSDEKVFQLDPAAYRIIKTEASGALG